MICMAFMWTFYVELCHGASPDPGAVDQKQSRHWSPCPYARRKGENADPAKHAGTETVTFSPLPCWKHLSPEAYRERVRKLGLEIDEEAAARRKRTGAQPFGVAAILAQHPWTRPERVKKSPAPLLHAASKAVRQVFYEGFAPFGLSARGAVSDGHNGLVELG